MDFDIIKVVGKIAGIGGLSLGVFFLLFKEIIRKNIFPKLTRNHAYKLMRLLSILIWSVAITGIFGWIILEYLEKNSLSSPKKRETGIPLTEKHILIENGPAIKTFGTSSPIVINAKEKVEINYNE